MEVQVKVTAVVDSLMQNHLVKSKNKGVSFSHSVDGEYGSDG